jgi:hypothetical protein
MRETVRKDVRESAQIPRPGSWRLWVKESLPMKEKIDMNRSSRILVLGMLTAYAYVAFRRSRRQREAVLLEAAEQRWEGEGGQPAMNERPDTRFATEAGPAVP